MPELSRRELECLRLASEGNTSAEIAEKLNLSERTVEHYLTSAARKLNANTRTQAVAIALRSGILDENPPVV